MASKLSFPLTGTPMTGLVVWAAMVPGRAADSPATAMKTFAVVFRIRSRSRSGVRWAEATTISFSTPNSSRIEHAFLPISESVFEPRPTRTSHPGSGRSALHDRQEEQADCGRGADDCREDHANRLGDDREEIDARRGRASVPAPEGSDDEADDEEPDPHLAALATSEIGREGPGDDHEQGEGHQENGQEGQSVERVECHRFPSELDPRQGLRVDDSRDRPDLVNDDLTEDIEIFRFDFGDEIILPEQRVELHDFLDLEELVVNFVLLGRSGTNEHEPDSHLWSPPRGKLLTQYNPFVATTRLRAISVFSLRTMHISGPVGPLVSTSAASSGCPSTP